MDLFRRVVETEKQGLPEALQSRPENEAPEWLKSHGRDLYNYSLNGAPILDFDSIASALEHARGHRSSATDAGLELIVETGLRAAVFAKQNEQTENLNRLLNLVLGAYEAYTELPPPPLCGW